MAGAQTHLGLAHSMAASIMISLVHEDNCALVNDQEISAECVISYVILLLDYISTVECHCILGGGGGPEQKIGGRGVGAGEG